MAVLSDALFAAQFLDIGGAVFNVKHPDFGAVGDGVADDGPAWNTARAAISTNGGVLLVPPGSYLLTTAFTFGAQSNVLLCIMSGVVLTGSALPTPTGTNAIVDWRSGIGKFTGTFEAHKILIVETAVGEAGLFRITRAGVLRWQVGWANNPDSWVVFRYNDAGTFLGTALNIDRSTGKAVFEAEVEIGGVLDLGSDIEFSSRNATLAENVNDDVASGTVTVQRFTTTGTGSQISGLSGGRAGRMIIVVNLGANLVTLLHDDAGSLAANRMLLPGQVNTAISVGEQVGLFYDSTTARWRLFANAV